MGYPILWAKVPGTLALDQQIANSRYGTPNQQAGDTPLHPHLIDIYEPDGQLLCAMAALHGGAGTKKQMASALGIIPFAQPQGAAHVNWKRLAVMRTALWVPQGQKCSGVNDLWGAGNNPFNPNDVTSAFPSWSNHDQYSGVDDEQFCIDLAAAMHARYSSTTTISVLAGHSAGGFMASTMWYRHTVGLFACYCACSATAPIWYLDNPATPVAVKPMYRQFGAMDTTLQIYPGHFYDPIWYQKPANIQPIDVQYPVQTQRIGAMQLLQTQVNAYNTAAGAPGQIVSADDGVTEAVKEGSKTTWTYCGGDMVVSLLSAADHSTKRQQQCDGKMLLGEWVRFSLGTVAGSGG